jgi:SAM-dependent methyltransferase
MVPETPHRCRSCGSADLKPFLDLGSTPLADALVKPSECEQTEGSFPLAVAFCGECTLVQILETVDPEVVFQRDYPYYSSFSDALLRHSRDNALDLMERRHLGSGSLVVELASNDGYLLKNFVEAGIPVLGIDPAEGPAEVARKIGVETMNDFFSLDLARKLASEGRRADVLVANNVLAHVADTNGFVEGIAALLKDNGVAVIEMPWVRDLIEHREFDTIYHEHLCYFSATALDSLFRRHGLYLNDVRHLDIHGGSLRIYVEPVENVGIAVKKMLAQEATEGLSGFDYYRDFADRVLALRGELRDVLSRLKSEGHSIAAYGAAAKGSTLLNFFDLGTDLIDFVVDRNTHKQGKLMPGVHIPIHAPEKLLEDQPDYVLMLTWNFRDEILQQQQEYLSRGGQFIIPIPAVEIVSQGIAAN